MSSSLVIHIHDFILDDFRGLSEKQKFIAEAISCTATEKKVKISTDSCSIPFIRTMYLGFQWWW